jgi:hypothetical protein
VSFSVEGFSDWIGHKKDEQSFEIKRPKKHELIGMEVQPKLNLEKISNKINAIDGNIDQLVVDFFEMGGSIADVKGKEYIIEVDSGIFSIKRCYVKEIMD